MDHMTMQSVPLLDTLGAIALVLWAVVMWAAVGFLAYAGRRTVRPWVYYASIGVIVLGVLGQLGHVQEHVAQTAYWVIHPQAQPWMTPWGTGLANGFGLVDQMKPSLGMEILHFVGNLIFLAGMAGVVLVTRRAVKTKSHKWGVMGVWMQGLHGIEHLVLMLSVWFGAPRAIGLSTWFGLMDPGPGLWTYRVWWHFIANVVGTVIFGIALWHLWKERRQVAASFQPEGVVPEPRKPELTSTR